MGLDYRDFRIVCADSDAETLRAFQRAVGDGFTVMTVSSGREALQALANHDVALLMSEQQLSDMSGLELCRCARRLYPTVVRVLTAHVEELDAQTALAAVNLAQISGYVPKPWRSEQLIECLRNALESRQTDSTLQNMGMRLWHRGQVAAAATIYEELVHELSNPLGALEINASLVEDQLSSLLHVASASTKSDESLRATLESALEAHSDSLAAIEQLKGLVSRMRHGRAPALVSSSGRCDAGSVIDATVRIVRAEIERVASLEVELGPLQRAVQIDAHALGQVLLNLLLNAAQAFGLEARNQHRVRVLAREQRGQFELTVQDNGVGINEDHLERIFEPSFTTKEHGTGLGLAICRDLIAQAYGTIRVHSQPGAGAVFEVFVPVAKAD